MSKLSNAPAIIVWAGALLAILTPPQIAATGLTALVQAQEHMFELLVEEPVEVAYVAPKPPARALRPDFG